MTNTNIRKAEISDAEKLLKIYAPYIQKTAITFEYEIPTLEEFRNRIKKILEKFPYICAVQGDSIKAYAYASSFKERAAYQWSVEVSIYVAEDSQRKGLGRLLYTELEKELKKSGIVNIYACVAVPTKQADEYLTWNSEQFHTHLGFKKIGKFTDCAKKFNHWYSMIWMEKIIGEHK